MSMIYLIILKSTPYWSNASVTITNVTNSFYDNNGYYIYPLIS